MNLTELLKKRQNGEDLTEEEKAFLAEYDTSIAVHLSEINKLKAEKESAEAKYGNANTELQDKLRILAEKEDALKKELEEKENMKKIIDNAKSAEEAKIEIERARSEKARIEEIARVEKANAEKLEKEKEDRKAFETKQKELEEKVALMEFEKKVVTEKSKRPYLDTQLTKILTDLPTKGVNGSEMYFNILLDMFNHEEEMKKWNDKQKENTDIFSKKEQIIVDTKETKVKNSDDEYELAKSLGFKVRKK